MLALWNGNTNVELPTELPPVVANAVLLGGNSISFYDDPYWVGTAYTLHTFPDSSRIIDSAQEIYENQYRDTCNDSDLLIHSCFPTKPLSGIDGGFISTNEKELADYFRCLVNNGLSSGVNSWDKRAAMVGFKMYMSSTQAYVIKQNFKKLPQKLTKMEEICYYYDKMFGLSNLSYHLYRVNVKADRKQVLRKLYEQGIVCGHHYPLLHKQKIYCKDGPYLPKSERDSLTTLSIPFHEKLTKPELKYIVKNVSKYLTTSENPL